ncbi:MAG TPA: hypothetical protein VH639_08855 [Bryobacteraceae bacterium]
MAQNLEWFEQGGIQRAILPGGLFNNRLQQPALLRCGLLKKQLARSARQAKHIDGLFDRDWRGLLDILNLASQTILLLPQHGGLLVKELLGNAAV